jgi:hypothetical protein
MATSSEEADRADDPDRHARWSAENLCLHVRSLWYAPTLHFEWSTFIKMATVDPGLRDQIMDMEVFPKDAADDGSAVLRAKGIVRSIEARIACLEALGEESLR